MLAIGARVDWLTVAFQVRLDRGFTERLRARSEVAREHGSASFEWTTESPIALPVPRRYPTRSRWLSSSHAIRRHQSIWGELQFTQRKGVWNIRNEPHFRLHVEEHAPGGGTLRRCQLCRGLGFVAHRDECPRCAGAGQLVDPGWTVEISWYAQELAVIGLVHALHESQAIAALTGEVLDVRLRRLDLCADVAGWEISPDDVKRLAKRPRARWAVDDVGPKPAKPPRCTRTKACRERCTCEDMQVYGSGSTLRERKITGLAVGRGGALMARIYDKREELRNDRVGDRRMAEEKRWRAAGWDGRDCITRVEFQIRGEAIRELGVRDPFAVVEPVYKFESYVDASGKTKARARLADERVLTISNDTGLPCEKPHRPGVACTCREMTLVDRIEAIWRTCLEWVRLVEPRESASGKPIAVSRLADDPRWALLRRVRFANEDAAPIRRYRPRATASAAQALGVTLSQLGRSGGLEPLPEGLEHYDNDESTEAALRERLRRAFSDTADRTFEWLVQRHGSVANAAVAFAIKSNAKRARYLGGFSCDVEDRESRESRDRERPLAAVS